MSLVSYEWGSSDEESGNEGGEETQSTKLEPPKLGDSASASDISSMKTQSSDQVASLSTKYNSDKDELLFKTNVPKLTSSQTKYALPNLLEKGLKSFGNASEPLPLPAGFVTAEFENEEEIIEVEDTPFEPSVLLAKSKRKKASSSATNQEKPKSIGSLFSSLNPPWELDTESRNKSRKSKESVKISIPSAPEVHSDDEDEPTTKKLKPSESGTGLSLLLPKPKHSVSFGKMDNPNKPSAKQKDRPLIPYTLSKKKPESKQISYKPKSAEDDEDEPVSFFNFVEKPTQDNVNTETSHQVTETTPLTVDTISTNYGTAATLSYGLTSSAERTTYEYTSHDLMGTDRISDIAYQPGDSADWYGMQGEKTDDQEASTTYYDPSYTGQSSSGSSNNLSSTVQTNSTDSIDMEQVLKLQGGRGQREEVNFVDVHCDEHLAPSNEWLKQVSEERAEFSAKKKGGQMPSSQTKRKHQITYLAFQAKERELELRNQWANNRSAQRKSQSKYGF